MCVCAREYVALTDLAESALVLLVEGAEADRARVASAVVALSDGPILDGTLGADEANLAVLIGLARFVGCFGHGGGARVDGEHLGAAVFGAAGCCCCCLLSGTPVRLLTATLIGSTFALVASSSFGATSTSVRLSARTSGRVGVCGGSWSRRSWRVVSGQASAECSTAGHDRSRQVDRSRARVRLASGKSKSSRRVKANPRLDSTRLGFGRALSDSASIRCQPLRASNCTQSCRMVQERLPLPLPHRSCALALRDTVQSISSLCSGNPPPTQPVPARRDSTSFCTSRKLALIDYPCGRAKISASA